MHTHVLSNISLFLLMQLRLIGTVFLVCGLVGLMQPAAAQGPPPLPDPDARQGTMNVVAWPDRAQVEAWHDDLADRWLPQFDRIQIDYTYAVRDSVTDWQFTLAWSPGSWVHTGEDGVRPLADVEGPGRLEQLYVVANAVVDDSTRAVARFAFEAMNVGPRPDAVDLTWEDVSHEALFPNLDADAARALLAQAPTFEIETVERVQVLLPPGARSVATRDQETRDQRRAPRTSEPRSTNTVFVIRTGYIFGRSWPGTSARPPRADTAEPVDESTRGGRGRSTTADADDEDDDRPRRDDDDEDDGPSLGPAAMGAAAVVGITAVAGGSIGISGTGDTPLGLSAGWTSPKGGVWLEASINGAVLDDVPGQQLSAQLRGFTDIDAGAIQPAIGLGLRYEQDDGDLASTAIVAPGIVWNRDPVAVSISYDLVNATPQWGLVFNLRSDAW